MQNVSDFQNFDQVLDQIVNIEKIIFTHQILWFLYVVQMDKSTYCIDLWTKVIWLLFLFPIYHGKFIIFVCKWVYI